MSSYKNQKIYNYLLKKKSCVDVKKYIITKDDSGQNYALFQMVNNYHDVLNQIVLTVRQYDSNKQLINETEIPYNNLNVKAHCKFVPYFKLIVDQNTDKIEATIKTAIFNEHKFINGKMTRFKKEKVEEVKKREGIIKRVNVLKTDAPKKMFLVMSGIVLLFMAVFILFFSFSNRTLVDQELNIAINNSSGYIVDYYGSDSFIVIPEKICNVQVKGVGEEAFRGSNAQSVTFNAKSVTIGKKAFYGCSNLKHVSAIEINGIGDSAFENCRSLEGIIANGPGLTIKGDIGKAAFRNCSSLIKFESDNVKDINNFAFYDCTSLVNVNLPNSILYPSVFYNCTNLQEVTFGNISDPKESTLSTIFSNQNNYSNTIINTKMSVVPDDFIDSFVAAKYNFINPSVQISNEALADLKKIAGRNNYNNNGSYERLFDMIIKINMPSNGELVINDPGVKGILLSAVKNIGNSVTRLELQCSCVINSEFMNCFPNLNTLILGSDVSIEKQSFGLYKLKDLQLPVQGNKFQELFTTMPIGMNVRLIAYNGENGQVVPKEYFADCNNISTLSIDNFSKIEKNAITRCSNLKNLSISSSVTQMDLPIIGENCMALTDVTIPFIGSSNEVAAKYKELNTSCGFTKEINIVNSNAVKLVESCFEGCMLLKSIYLNRGITEDSKSCFKGVKQLDSLYINGNLGNKLISLFDYPTKINNLCIKGLKPANSNYFESVVITNLYLEGSNIDANTFKADNQISVINISISTVGTGFEESLDSIKALNKINYQKTSSSYNHTKNTDYGFDYYTAYAAVFN